MVWESDVTFDSEGWVAEFKIPYSALRFPKTEIQTWGLNIKRSIRRNREWYTWSFRYEQRKYSNTNWSVTWF